MKYRVILYISYHESYYEFDIAEEAINFAALALKHSTRSEDTKKATKIKIEVFDPLNEEEDD